MYDWQPEEATRLWEKSVSLDASFPLARRNLAVAWSHGKSTNELAGAIAQLEQAVAGPDKFALHFAELDELYAAAGVSPEKRLALLEANQGVVSKRDDALSREIGLKIFAGKYDEAIALMKGRQFAVWEGGRLDVADHWVQAHLLRGRQELAAGKAAEALADFERAKTIPDNLPSDQRGSGAGAEVNYWLGEAYEAAGNPSKAKECWTDAARGPGRGSRRGREARSLDEQAQALARRKLGENASAESAFRGMSEPVVSEETAGGTPSERYARRTRTALAHCRSGCGYAGLGENEKARAEFQLALQVAPDCLEAKAELASLPK
jgi:tetratricopeptide (TPR) repeat protein